MDDVSVLLTNDDGIFSPGIAALYETLKDVADVTIVAPTEDQSTVGRSLSQEVTVDEHDRGYAIDGTPADCVIAGIEGLNLSPDIVVSGCNKGANLGAYVIGRSGTISAAVEASFFDIPAIAVSLYIPEDQWPRQTTIDEYAEAGRVTEHLIRRGLESDVFDYADLLNVNVPLPSSGPTQLELTRPSPVYSMTADRNGRSIVFADGTWDRMIRDELTDPPGTDRRTLAEGKVSVSPVSPSNASLDHPVFQALLEGYGPMESMRPPSPPKEDGN